MAGVCKKANPANAWTHRIALDAPNRQQPRNDKEHRRNPKPPSAIGLESCECHNSGRVRSRLTVLFTQSQPGPASAGILYFHGRTIRDAGRGGQVHCQGLAPRVGQTPNQDGGHFLACHNSPAKEKLTLSFIRLLYDPIHCPAGCLVSAMGRSVGQASVFSVATASPSAG